MITPKLMRKRVDRAQKNLDDFRSMLGVAYDYTMPENNQFYTREAGKEENLHVYDHTAPNGVVVAANRMQGGLFPPKQKFIKFASGADYDEGQKELDDALIKATDEFFSYFHASNFDTEINPALQESLISTGYIQIDEQPIWEDVPFRFSAVSTANVLPEKPTNGTIENCHRRLKVAAGAIKETWPEAKMPTELQKVIDRDEFEEVDIIVSQIKERNKYWLYVMWEKEFLFKEERDYKFIIPFRESVSPNEVLGRGPIIRLLPIIRRVNKVMEMGLQAAAINIFGVFTARSDGDFNPFTARIEPQAVIPVDSNDNQNPTLRQLDKVGDAGLADFIVGDMQAIIEKVLFINPLGDVTDPVKSATEQMIRQQEQLRSQGVAIGRLNTELSDVVVRSVVAILRSRGKLPKEFKVDGRQVRIVYESPLAKASQLDDFQNMQTFLGTMQQVFDPSVVQTMGAVVKVEELPSAIAKMLSVDSNLLRSEDEREQLASAIAESGVMDESGTGTPSI